MEEHHTELNWKYASDRGEKLLHRLMRELVVAFGLLSMFVLSTVLSSLAKLLWPKAEVPLALFIAQTLCLASAIFAFCLIDRDVDELQFLVKRLGIRPMNQVKPSWLMKLLPGFSHLMASHDPSLSYVPGENNEP